MMRTTLRWNRTAQAAGQVRQGWRVFWRRHGKPAPLQVIAPAAAPHAAPHAHAHAHAAAHAAAPLAVSEPVPAANAEAVQYSTEPPTELPPPPRPPRKKGGWGRRIWRWCKILFWLVFLTALGLLAWFGWREMHDAKYQAQFFHEHARQAGFTLAEGESKNIRFPAASPFDERLGYASLPEFSNRLKQRDYAIVKQARITPKMAEIADLGLFMPWREKTQAGLEMADCHLQPLFAARYPERVFSDFNNVPPLLVSSLLFIENRELLDQTYPKRNPAVEWDRLAKAVLEQAAHGFDGEHKTAGGSTLATQIEKYRHSPEGRTSNAKDKLRQMISASLRAYQAGEDTSAARRQIVLDYLNTVPLSAKPGFGEVNGIGDGLWAWYGRDFHESRELLQRAARAPDPLSAMAYKEALSLMIAQRRPSWYLGDADSDLDSLTNTHLRLLAAHRVITPQLRDAALALKLAPAAKGKLPPQAATSFVNKKAVTAMRTHLASLLGENRLYNIDRLDLSAVSTINAEVQQSITAMLRDLRDGEKAKAAGLTGKGLLGNGDPAQVVYSFTLLERGEDANYLRLQTDNFDQPLDINDGAKLDLGSTAKLRTLISYLDIVANLHAKHQGKDEAALQAVVIDPKDKMSRWAVEFLQENQDASLEQMLEAALQRQYSASTGEGFFTGGGMHYFNNFKKEDNGRIMSVREAMRHSVNLVFVRMMRDVVHHYMFHSPGSSASLLSDVDDPRRADYLARFADREGREFIQRFYPKYKGKSAQEAEKILLQNLRPTPHRLAALYRTIAPQADLAAFSAFLRDNLPNDSNQEKLSRLYEQYAPEAMPLQDRGYVARIHPLELVVVGYLRQKPGASLSDVIAASAKERQQVYTWLFNTHRKHAQDKRIAGLLEVEGFLEVHKQWKKMGYPFDSMVPSYASALGASADRPSALAEMMGIIINDGVRKPTWRISSLHFAAGSPYETLFQRQAGKGEQVLPKEVARAVQSVINEVVTMGTAKRLANSFVRSDGSVLPVGGKTGTGDQRFEVWGAGGRLIESRYVNRSATFVFNIDSRYFGSITAYVSGAQSENYDFTSALPVQLLKTVAPRLMPLLEAGKPQAGLPGMCST
ncbi:transglycosylase domain-containing protein [Massilia sp. W12]|uniref:transglycosylase domain-containing protein n=1 Tax=Massilia sp. W12 TaxID=3126507 RepID=UPI0030D2DBA7